ncbi:hypothetical protein SDC9_124444 [bioreactor metagenome]|uniref:Uncharacterized protein n=1 Tax=bioreactor metagenome TaxID=1076179 RepID=A0A645CKF6_9ZZZZ
MRPVLGSRRRRTRLSHRVSRSSVSARATVSWEAWPAQGMDASQGRSCSYVGNAVTPSSLSSRRNTCQAFRSSGVRRRSRNSRRGTVSCRLPLNRKASPDVGVGVEMGAVVGAPGLALDARSLSALSNRSASATGPRRGAVSSTAMGQPNP